MRPDPLTTNYQRMHALVEFSKNLQVPSAVKAQTGEVQLAFQVPSCVKVHYMSKSWWKLLRLAVEVWPAGTPEFVFSIA